nr:cell wall mannoprotein 1 [Quercus suber]
MSTDTYSVVAQAWGHHLPLPRRRSSPQSPDADNQPSINSYNNNNDHFQSLPLHHLLATMLFKAVAALGFLAATVAADGAAIVSALHTIQSANAALNTSIATWKGDLIGALPILINSNTLINDINNGTAVANASAPLDTNESINVYTAVTSLSNDVNRTLTSIIAAKPKFDKLFISGITKTELQNSKTATDKFGAAVVAKVPAYLQSTAQGVVTGLDDMFNRALAVYA